MSGAPAVVALTSGSWDEALERSGFWALLSDRPAPPSRIVILVDLGGARPGDPDRVQPRAVEALIDLIHGRCDATVELAASADESRLWAGNRDVYALAELLGYRFVTDQGNEYDIVDLAEDLADAPFAHASALRGSGLATAWIDADIRLNVARLRTDPGEGFAAGLVNLLGCLPHEDKALQYRHRRDLAEVIDDLLATCPPHHTLIDAGGETDATGSWAIASGSPLLADYAAALKAGLDPFASPLLAAVAARRPLPPGYRIDGSIEPLDALQAPLPLAQRAARERQRNEAGDRLVSGWLRRLDPEMFPANRPLDLKAGTLVAALLGDGSSPSGRALMTAADVVLGAGARAVEAWRTLFDKDSLTRRIVSLGIDPAAIPRQDFAAAVAELEALLPIAAAAPQRAEALRWRKFEGAVLFEYHRRTAIPFDLFVAKVDISRTIEYMNDYLGGVVVVVERDEQGRPIRQGERNLYLPQPNFLVLYGGKPIDVTKIETVRYEADAHRLYWKTLHSSNGSATADDGVAFFERDGDGTRVTIAGKQRFTLPPAMQLFDLALWPELEARLTTDAYKRFFDRTFANFEALVEGRDIHIGRPPEANTAHPSGPLEDTLKALVEQAAPVLARFKPTIPVRPPADARGFVHMGPQR